MKEIKKDQLNIQIHEDRPALGRAAAEQIAAKINALLAQQELVSIIFASAPSQNEFLAELVKKDIDWSRIVAFHMDEYIGLNPDAPQGFANFLKDRIFSKVQVGQVHYMDGNTGDPQGECNRYAALLAKYPVDIVILGIGENTHLAFNDPHVADFNDPLVVKVVDLDQDCRLQQVNDGAFPLIEDVPSHAITITIPALLEAKYAYAIVPGKFKADAIYHTVNNDISEMFPSTILRKKANAVLYIDEDSAAKLTY
ncbi:glucosamine-6-phosphate deaminase [Parapedobacter lycopersici]|uniref:glucosamine-6-phosphate deaminase n=1 Tax=Parapedobacter lycopersici TaxID=1864939 RepID=UPI00214D613C|nr:glucosamine-6-phosphate deaminase [Parapedobacter lycopersici]